MSVRLQVANVAWKIDGRSVLSDVSLGARQRGCGVMGATAPASTPDIAPGCGPTGGVVRFDDRPLGD